MRHVLRLLVLLLLIAGGNIVLLSVVPLLQTGRAIQQIRSKDPAVRRRGLGYVRDERAARAVEAVLERIEHEDDPDLVELAGYTAMRIRDLRGVAPLMRRADREPDSPLKARLMVYAARLSDGDYRLVPWLRATLTSAGPWGRVGSAAGLLQLGRPEGADTLLALAAEVPPEPREFAFGELRGVTQRMAQTVGFAIAFDSPERESVWAQLRGFWKQYGRTALLCDALARVDHVSPDWREVERLLHARERVARWLE